VVKGIEFVVGAGLDYFKKFESSLWCGIALVTHVIDFPVFDWSNLQLLA
jgi:hypothetical protein